MDIRKDVLDSLETLREIRRALHAIPEGSYKEFKTQEYIMERLRAYAPDELLPIAGTGIKAVFRADGATRTTAFRADMDALPVPEATGLPFASMHPGMMHACGHDAHMATTLTLCSLIAKNRERLGENAVALFQPAEECGCGAAKMIASLALENPHVDRIYGFHVSPGIPVGKIGLRSGPMMARATGFNIIVEGQSAHGAMPHLGHDAIVAASALVTMLQSIISRGVDPMDNAVLTVGKLTAGERRNIIAERAKLECTVRTYLDETHAAMFSSVRSMCKAIADAYGVKVTIEDDEDYYAVVNDGALYREYCSIAGDAAFEAQRRPSSEDFSFYQRETPGLFVLAGVGENVAPLHTGTMFFDESALLPMLEMDMRLLGL